MIMKTRMLLSALLIFIFGLLSGAGTAYANEEDVSKT